MVRTPRSYCDFADAFLGPALSLFAGQIPRLSEGARRLLRTENIEKGDWYFTPNNTIIKLSGFGSKAILLPFHVTDRIFAIEFRRQLDCVDAGKGKKKTALYSVPLSFPSIPMREKGVHPLLKQKLLDLKLREMNGEWEYDPASSRRGS